MYPKPSIQFLTSITNEAGQVDYPCYWTGTTHVRGDGSGAAAVYVAFGRAMGYMNGQWIDVHGAGAQRSDPKSGDPADYPYGRGPQGDAIRIYNYVRAVRGGLSEDQSNIADLNQDNVVNILDIAIVASAFGTTVEDPEWNPIADVAEPYGEINILDIARVALDFGKTV